MCRQGNWPGITDLLPAPLPGASEWAKALEVIHCGEMNTATGFTRDGKP